MRSHRPTTNSCPNRATVDRRVSSRTMCFDLTTHSQMLSFEDCTIRVVQDQSPNPFVRDIDQENQAMNHSALMPLMLQYSGKKPCQTHTRQSLTLPPRSRNAFQIFWNFGLRIRNSKQCCAPICRNSPFRKA